jgi:flagella basal body P-ring formation protein FlgA
MIRFAYTVALVLMLGGAALAQEPPRPVLKAHATVHADLVKIGDLVENAGLVANVPIFRAPDLGTSGTVSAEAVATAVQKHALVGLDTAGLTEVTVTRPARTIPAKDIEDAVAQALAAQYQLGAAKDVAVSFDGIVNAVNVEPSALGEPRVIRVAYDQRTSRFDASVELPTGATSRGNLRLTGRAVATLEVVTLANSVDRGTVLKDADVVVERRPRADVSRDALTDPERARGLAARSNLQAGAILRAADPTKPEVVQRNDMVTLSYAMPGLMLTVRGKALDGGAEGDIISVVNEQSKRTLQAVITGPGRAAISAGAPRFAANLEPGR